MSIDKAYQHYFSWITSKQDAMYVIGLLIKKFNINLQDFVNEVNGKP